MSLNDIAINSLTRNIVKHSGKKYILAGSYQFKTIWIRDACFSAEALHLLGLDEITDNLISLCLANVKNGVAPKGFDSMNLEWRCVKVSIRHTLGLERISDPFEGPLEPMYVDTRDSVAIDSNILLCLVSFYSGKFSKDKRLIKLLDYYNNRKNKDGLIEQDPYSDWQDSQMRTGATFLTNLLYYIVLEKYEAIGIHIGPDLKELKKTIINTFYDKKSGLFISVAGREHISLEGNLFAIKYKFYNEEELYSSLKKHQLWHGPIRVIGTIDSSKVGQKMILGPGFPTSPDYPYDELHVQVKFGQLYNYHDSIYWGWLMGFSGAIAFMMADSIEGLKIYDMMSKMAKRDKCICELYSPEKNFPYFESSTYSTERPFSWASANVIMMCHYKRICDLKK